MFVEIIVGLGNPGEKYLLNRHNIGFWLVDLLAESYHGQWQQENKFQAFSCKIEINSHTIFLLKPQTYMNESGKSVGPFCRYYRLAVENCLVVYDELDLPVATVRLKKGGGPGGHNGMRSIIQHFGAEVQRLRIGIGHPGQKHLVSSYVLSNAPPTEQQSLMTAVKEAAGQIPHLVSGDWDRAVRHLHGLKSE